MVLTMMAAKMGKGHALADEEFGEISSAQVACMTNEPPQRLGIDEVLPNLHFTWI
jgi:hypothetical protein